MPKYVKRIHEKSSVDVLTGKTLSSTVDEEIEKVHTVEAERYFVVFQENLPLLSLLTKKERSVFDYLCKVMEFNTVEVRLTPQDRRDLCEELGITRSSFSNVLSKFRKKQLLIEQQGRLYVNPFIAFKGDMTKTRAKVIKSLC